MQENIIFRLKNNQLYSLDLMKIKKVINLKDVIINTIPTVNKYHKGILMLDKENHLNVYDLNDYMEVQNKTNENNELILIVNYNNKDIAFIIKKVEMFFKIENNKRFEYSGLNKKIKYFFYIDINYKTELVTDINLSALFGDNQEN